MVLRILTNSWLVLTCGHETQAMLIFLLSHTLPSPLIASQHHWIKQCLGSPPSRQPWTLSIGSSLCLSYICSYLGSNGVATPPVPLVPFFFSPLSLDTQPRIQEERGCSFHYLPINGPTLGCGGGQQTWYCYMAAKVRADACRGTRKKPKWSFVVN